MTTADLRGRKVLVLEDEYYLAQDVADEIGRAGGRVIGPFPDSVGALTALEEATPDCAAVDINLGDGASFAVADALKARGVPFVFVTGYDAQAIPPAHADVRRLEKPLNRRRIQLMLEQLCAC